MNLADEDRFWLKVRVGDGCWLWTASTVDSGHGRFSLNGKMVGAHRVSWLLNRGPIPDGLDVLHDCPSGDNPSCVRPTHLWLGTDIDNQHDKKAKDRQAQGEDHGRAVLTVEQVRAIRAAEGGYGRISALARTFGVSRQTIYQVRRGTRVWTHVV
jgi:hypothetical protein